MKMEIGVYLFFEEVGWGWAVALLAAWFVGVFCFRQQQRRKTEIYSRIHEVSEILEMNLANERLKKASGFNPDKSGKLGPILQNSSVKLVAGTLIRLLPGKSDKTLRETWLSLGERRERVIKKIAQKDLSLAQRLKKLI